MAVVPGPAFDREGHFRVSFSTSREQIEEGIERLHRFFGRRVGSSTSSQQWSSVSTVRERKCGESCSP